MTVRADDITRPEVLTWMTRFQSDVLRAHGYRAGKRCTQERDPPELCPALSLPDLFGSAGAGPGARSGKLLAQVPPYFSQGVITRDRKTASLAFGIRLMPLDRQKEVVDDIKRRLDPPEGVSAAVVGPAGAGRRGERRALVAAAPRADAARRAGRGVPRAARRAALRRARRRCR